MSSHVTSSTVQAQGELHIAGVPFAPGTEVEITISPKRIAAEKEGAADESTLPAARVRMLQLFQTITGFRNSPKILREELYDRGSLR